MRHLLKIRFAKKFGIDPDNRILDREINWFMQQRDQSIESGIMSRWNYHDEL